jgi:hypothetical protein
MQKTRVDYEQFGIVIRGIEAYKCPKCREEVFTDDQMDHIQKRMKELLPQPRISRKTTKVARNPAVYLPKKLLAAVDLKIGDEIVLYSGGKRRVVIEATPSARAE